MANVMSKLLPNPNDKRPVQSIYEVECPDQKFKAVLTEYQVSRMNYGATSLYVNHALHSIAVAHAAIKTVQGHPPDAFTRKMYLNTVLNPDDSKSLKDQDPAIEAKTYKLSGASEPLHPLQTRVLKLRQPGSQEEDDPKWLHVVYDNERVCFIDEQGHCLYMKRNQLPLHTTASK